MTEALQVSDISDVSSTDPTNNENARSLSPSKVAVGSRESKLAMIQTNHVIHQLDEVYKDVSRCPFAGSQMYRQYAFEVNTMKTTGDKILDHPLSQIGSKSLFTKELEEALLASKVKFIVHSLKDLPTTLPAGCSIGAILKREEPFDCLVIKDSLRDQFSNPLDILTTCVSPTKRPSDSAQSISEGNNESEGSPSPAKHSRIELDRGFRIGTSSLRRISQLKRLNDKIIIDDVRGNLNTRLAKLDAKPGDKFPDKFDALILAAAGMKRSGFEDRISFILRSSESFTWYHAVGQGALAVECQDNDQETLQMLFPLIDYRTMYEAIAERSFMRKLEGGCSVPIGVTTEWVFASEEGASKSESNPQIPQSCPFSSESNHGNNSAHQNDPLAPNATQKEDCLKNCSLSLKGAVLSVDGLQCISDKICRRLDEETDFVKYESLLTACEYTGISIPSELLVGPEMHKIITTSAKNAFLIGYLLADRLIELGAQEILDRIKKEKEERAKDRS